MMYDFTDWLIVISITTILFIGSILAVIIPGYYIEKASCSRVANEAAIETRYATKHVFDITSPGCLVMVNDQWISVDKWRAVSE